MARLRTLLAAGLALLALLALPSAASALTPTLTMYLETPYGYMATWGETTPVRVNLFDSDTGNPIQGTTICWQARAGSAHPSESGSGTSDANGDVSFSYPGTYSATSSTDTFDFYADNGGTIGTCGDTGDTTIAPTIDFGAASFDVMSPSNAHYPIGAPAAITTTLYSAEGAPLASHAVTRGITSGPDATSDAATTTDGGGSVTVSWTNSTAGTDTPRVWADVNGNATFEAAIDASATTDTTFVTPGSATVDTLSALSVGSDGATVRGTLDPGGVDGTYYFEYGTSAAYGSQTAPTGISGTSAGTNVSDPLSGLDQQTTYHYRLVLERPTLATVYGPDQTFTTTLMAVYCTSAGCTPVTATASDIAAALSGPTAAPYVTGSSFPTIGGSSAAVTSTALTGFPLDGGTFAILSSGYASNAAPGSSSLGTSPFNTNPPGRGDTANDVTVMKIDVNVPAGANCLSVDFRFLSAEYPTYVGSNYNDAFIAELDTSSWTTAGSVISAPDNFAFGPDGKVISINSTGVANMTAGNATGTSYGGATDLLRASKIVAPGPHSLYLSIFDQGDHSLDSAVFVDRLSLVDRPAEACVSGVTSTQAVTVDTPLGGTTTGPLPALTGTASAGSGDSDTVTVDIYSGSAPGGAPVRTMTTTRSGYTWSASVPASAPLPSGTYTAQATQTTTSGTITSAPKTFNVDATGPGLTLDALPAETTETSPLFSGSAGTAPGDSDVTLEIYAGTAATGVPLQTVVAPRSGSTWSARPSSPLTVGRSYTVQAKQSDSFGNAATSQARTFTVVAQQQQQPLPRPVFRQSVNVEPVGGTVFVTEPGGKKVALTRPDQIKLGSIIDTTHGRVRLTIADKNGKLQSAEFYEGVFKITQLPKTKGGFMNLKLVGGNFKACPAAQRSRAAKGKKLKKTGSAQHLWGSGTGSFRTQGRYSAAAVRGTTWLTDDRCDGTLTRVTAGQVAVHDDVRNKTVVVKKGQKYLAKPR